MGQLPSSTAHELTETQMIAAVEWMARHHGQPFTAISLKERLPRDFAKDGPNALCRALEVVGLKSRLVHRRIDNIDPGSLPVLLFLKENETPLVLSAIDDARGHVSVFNCATQETHDMPLRGLAKSVQPVVILTTPKAAATSSRLSPDAVEIDKQDGHWLWSELARHKAAWFQVFLAALGVNLAGLALPIFIMNVFDRVIPNLAFVTLVTLAIGVGLALALDFLLRLLRSAIIQRVSRRADLALASRLFSLALSQRMLSRRGGAAGAITNLRDFEHVRDFFASSTIVSIIDLAFIGLFLAVLSLIVGPLVWIPIVAIPIILTIAIVAQVPISRAARQAQQMNLKRNVVLFESLSGLETVKSIGAEPAMQREWENAVAASSRVTAQTRNWSTFTSAATVLTQQAVSVGIICLGVFLVADGQITLGALVAANILAGRILAPLAGIAQTIFRANFAIWSLRSINAFVKTDTEQADTLRSDLVVQRGAIELNAVSFTYPEAKLPALVDVTARFEAGSTTALLGRIGSGKSTLGKLLNGTYVAHSGSILVDGHEIAQFEPAELRAGIGYLPQDPVLFTGTLRENVAIGVAGATDDQIMRALYLAGIDGFVASLPEGLDFFTGEKGERLSGGQRQSVALARLLVRQPKFLFLDEPTNAMDHQTEAVVVQRLTELQRDGVGMILCTHRMSLAQIADRYVVIERGQKVMDGPKDMVVQKLNSMATHAQSEAS